MSTESEHIQEPRAAIESALASVRGTHDAVFAYLVARVRDGFFEQHQSKGRIDAVADEVLRLLRSAEPDQGDS